MKHCCIGVLAHVDAGKTTLSEALLYRSGTLRRLGRVDHRDAFLDTDAMERERGITIFSKQAEFSLPAMDVTLLDTPGHVDFSAEAERTLRVLDCAILVISGTDGVQGHTRTLWRLLEQYGVPVFLFVNKMDLSGADRTALMADLKRRLDSGCVDFGTAPEELAEEAAVCDEEVLERYLESGEVSDDDITAMIASRKLFPCFFGSALKLEGVDDFLEGLERYAPVPDYPAAFGARVFKIARDSQGARLTYLKVTGGTLRVKDLLTNCRPGLPEDKVWEEKADQLRVYSGVKFRPVEEAPAGTVVAVTGLSRTVPGEGLGFEEPWTGPVLEPVLTYQVGLTDGTDPHTALLRLRQLEEEDPQLHIVWNEAAREIHIQLMGEVQLEILQRLIQERFGMEVAFGAGAICYRETIAAPVEGIGHFEPLRHYAEVHLLMEPGPRGSGLVLGTACPTDELDLNWQRLILTHLAEREHPGVLTGSPITDMKITLAAGRAHEKHTEGGDFRQATYRAVRQGLMQAENILLEPWYEFRLELPADQVGRAMSDLQRMNGEVDPPETFWEETTLTGSAPVAALRDYAREVTAYTRGRGRLLCVPAGYRPCADQETIVAASGYDPERDVDNPPDSVFCSHGAGVNVKWNEVPARAHVDSGLRLGQKKPEPEAAPQTRRPSTYAGTMEQDKELQAIFERTYGPVKRQAFTPPREPKRPVTEASARAIREQVSGPEYLLVDGYNIIFAWDELKAIARDNLDAARKALCDLLCNYQGYQKCVVIVVFDAYKVKGGLGSVEKYHNIHVVYTKEAETADAYIEKATYEIGKQHRVKVATSDGPEQLIILGHGALRVSATGFHEEMERVRGQISGVLDRNNQKTKQGAVRAAMEKALEGTEGGSPC
ncbi:TetM/TetW/TetO/TetS family tetracycline resistance ribosomal protection protein [Oscillibacter valericigenes]|uniref:translation factor GTPase family protein n=1 Tax=Oscillibacter valericigenes TaxID=351091 RepID=UPI001F369040|nr:TetM/TetW/TetO/TetS family tetracycline resistance ribosomal protection protein [Oscillibacter valericigenes]MCF2665209.1 TetM/TetW/TetO/TetS family tetracycline resistance ribosomal protection protein [Oscillibacter valericigenes]